MIYKTYQELSKDIQKNLWKLPDIDLVVGIPRSGMIPAYMLGFLLNTPVCSLDEFSANLIKSNSHRVLNTQKIHNVLVIDDACSSGRAIREAKESLVNILRSNKYKIIFGSVYVLPGSEDKVDVFFEYASAPRMFQWNYLNHPEVIHACFDIDGVLCYDPKPEENDDGEKYRHFILNAKPLSIPKYKIKALVTSRLEKYRKETEQWLKDHNVQYEKLYMLDLPNQAERIKQNAHAKFKAKIYAKIDSPIFYESELGQAKEIFLLTGKPVFCVDTNTLIQSKEQATNEEVLLPYMEKKYKCRIRLFGITLFSKRKKGDKRIYRILGIKIVLHKKKKSGK